MKPRPSGKGQGGRQKSGSRPQYRAGASPGKAGPSAAPRFLWLAAILLTTFIAYVPSLDNDFTNWDDPQYVTENPLLARPNVAAILTKPIGGNYHPLTIFSLVLNHSVAGLNPAAYHWTNLVLHLANTALVFVFVWMLSGGRRWTTVLTSLLFGIHPMHVESVAWIAERKDVLYTVFYLAGLITYLKYTETKSAAKYGWWSATFVAFVLSLASKPAAVVFPVTLLLIDWFRRRAWKPVVVLEKIPFFAAALAGGLLTLTTQTESGALEKQFPLLIRIFSGTYGLVMYIVKLLVPIRLSAIYPFPNIEGHGPSIGFYVTFFLAVVVIPLALYLLRRERYALFGFAFYLLNIVLVMQFVAVGKAVMADRYTYVPYIGLLFALAWPLDSTAGGALARIRVPLAVGFGLLVAFSLVQTYLRCDVWQSSETLWNDTIQKYPRRIVDTYINRGLYYYKMGRYEAALADYDESIKLNARVPNAWNNRGMVFSDTGRPDSALICFDRAIALKPDLASAWNNRGGVKLMRGENQSGIADVSRAIQLLPTFRDAYKNRAIGYAQLKDYEHAYADSRRVVELDPRNAGNYLYHGLAASSLHSLGRYREAIPEFDEAIRFSPPGEMRLPAYYRERGDCWEKLGDRERAAADARDAARLSAGT